MLHIKPHGMSSSEHISGSECTYLVQFNYDEEGGRGLCILEYWDSGFLTVALHPKNPAPYFVNVVDIWVFCCLVAFVITSPFMCVFDVHWTSLLGRA